MVTHDPALRRARRAGDPPVRRPAGGCRPRRERKDGHGRAASRRTGSRPRRRLRAPEAAVGVDPRAGRRRTVDRGRSTAARRRPRTPAASCATSRGRERAPPLPARPTAPGQPCGAAHAHVPGGRRRRDVLQVRIAGQHAGGRLRPPAAHARKPVGRIGPSARGSPESRPGRRRTSPARRPHRAACRCADRTGTMRRPSTTWARSSVGRADEDLLDPLVGRGADRGGGEDVVGLVLHPPSRRRGRAPRARPPAAGTGSGPPGRVPRQSCSPARARCETTPRRGPSRPRYG